MMKSELIIAVAASQLLCTLATKSSSFKNICFLTNELTRNCKLKILPAQYGQTRLILLLLKFQFFHFLLIPLHFTQSVSSPWWLLVGTSSGNSCIIWSCLPKRSKTSVRGQLCKHTSILRKPSISELSSIQWDKT